MTTTAWQLDTRRIVKRAALSAFTAAILLGTYSVVSADETAPANRSIGFAITDFEWGLHQTEGAKAECPQGLNTLGPREQFKLRFPDDGTKRTLLETQLAVESEIWAPEGKASQFPLLEAGGKVALGLDLDGRADADDFTSPEGRPGVDNQLFRVFGCIAQHRDGASVLTFEKTFFKKYQIDRLIFELTDVDSLVNDDDLTITIYRGENPLVSDATGVGYVPGGTQRLDLRWGKQFIHSAKAKIVDGELLSEPLDFYFPHEAAYQDAAYYWLRGARLSLKLTADRGSGIVAGYADLDHLYYSRNRTWSTHHLSYGQEAMLSVHNALTRLADGYPDPATGKNTAISAALEIQFVRVHIIRPEPGAKEVASGGNPSAQRAQVSGGDSRR